MIKLAGKVALVLLIIAGCAQSRPITGAIVDGFPLGREAEPTPDAATAALAVQGA